MSEDRHTFSEPRPIPNLSLPTWDVDVFRDGVQEPILTLRIDATTLPPRKSKKKKVVWKLPDSVEQIPRFGVDEKRRLLDLFKNVKKERRKSRQKQALSADLSAEVLVSLEEVQTLNDDGGIDPASSTGNNIQQSDGVKQEEVLISKIGNMSVGGPSPATAQTSCPPGLTTEPIMGRPPEMVGTDAALRPAGNNGARPLASEGLASPPPPGLAPIVPTQPTAPPEKEPSILDRSQSQQPLPQIPPSQLRVPPPNAQLFSKGESPRAQISVRQAPASAPLPGISSSIPLLPPALYFECPTALPPDIFAEQVANLYISLLQNGRVGELLMYYTLTAQKSLSLKSAKSICQSSSEMKTQLQSLAGSAFVVQGITVQQGLNCSLLLVWSGICQLQGQHHGFCHTLILTPTAVTPEDNLIQYQIQNDALVLLTND